MQITFDNVYGNDIVYMDCLRSICGSTEGQSMVDLGCNLAPHTPLLGFEKRTYIDILERKLDHEEEQKYFIQADALEYLFKMKFKECDVSISSDNLEHFYYDDGVRLLHLMQWTSKKQVIFTPLGNHMVEDGNNPEAHHSGWSPENFNKDYAFVVFPSYHPTLGIGAFFAWSCENIEQDFERVKNELKEKAWTK